MLWGSGWWGVGRFCLLMVYIVGMQVSQTKHPLPAKTAMAERAGIYGKPRITFVPSTCRDKVDVEESASAVWLQVEQRAHPERTAGRAVPERSSGSEGHPEHPLLRDSDADRHGKAASPAAR